jgi:outer membrane protein OmpA-like peptidoglycan-associated protein
MPKDLARRTPSGVVYAESLDVSPRSFTQGFPGVTNRFEWFGIVYQGRFQVAERGSYTFRAVSDDGVALFIDGRKVLSDDTLHPARSSSCRIDLEKGHHSIKVWYFQGPRTGIALQVFVAPPGGQERVFSMKEFGADLGAALQELGGEATAEGILLHIDASILFDVDKAVLKKEAAATLAKLKTVLDDYRTANVQIRGYTSSEGEAEHNQKLSERRASAVKNALAKRVPGTVKLSSVGFGAASPVASNDTEDSRKKNRRVEILVRP